LESFLVREIRKEIGSIHRKIFGTFIKGIHDNRKASEIYEDLCKVLNEIFDSEKSFIIYEKGKKWNMVASFPKEIEIDYSFLDLNIKDEFSEERITMFFERKEGSVVISVLKPRNLHSIRLVKDTLGDYLDMILKLERFQRNSELLSTLQKLLQAEVSSFSLVEYLDEISKLIKENLGYAFVGILLREGDYLKLISAWGSEKYKDLNVDLKIGEEGISGVAYKKGETVYSPDVSKDPFYVKVSDEISSEISVPLKSPKGLLGTLVISSSKPYAFSDEDIAFLETLAEQISLFIQERLDKEEKEEIISFLEEESKFNEMIIRNLPIGIVVIDNDLKIKRVNEGMVLLLKRNVKEMLGSKICEILCSHEEEGYCKIKDSFLNRKILFKEKFIIDVEGESVPMAVTSSFIYTSYNVISGIILMVEDIREVAKLEEQLRRSERLSAIGKIAAYMAHEIKNPLASISTGIEFVSEKLPPDESVRGYMNMILKEIYRLDRLIKNLLSFASRKPLNKVSVNVFEILNECITLLTPEIIGKDIKLKTDFKEKELMVHLDPDQFKEVVLNLVRNAIDAIDKDGEVELGFEKVGSRVVFWCKDNGKGIREEYVHNIFEPFFSTKKGGSGLGLAIVHKIVEDHGGKIEVESDYGKGTIFKVYLPL
jgi:two-component system sensor histidine kinase HydH